jgi:hypothetical protein
VRELMGGGFWNPREGESIHAIRCVSVSPSARYAPSRLGIGAQGIA